MNLFGDAQPYGRRKFIHTTIGLAAAQAVIPFGASARTSGAQTSYTVKHVIDRIVQEVPGAPFANTVDQLRSGNPDQEVTGIVTTMFPTLEVIDRTVRAGANMIIAHETPYYNNQDETDWLQEDDAYKFKRDLLDKHRIAVWRFHDYWHAHRPDGIIMGNLRKLGWDKFYDPEVPRMLRLPQSLALKEIAKHCKERLGIASVRVVGKLDRPCTTMYLAFGYMDSRRQIAAIQQYKPDLILSGETREWETVERVRDGLYMGANTSLLVLSHSVSEEAGMEYAARWLQALLPSARITHLPSGSPFQHV